MKKIWVGIIGSVLILGGLAYAQVPALFLTTMTGTEQIDVRVPSTGGVVISPRITTITSSNLRDTSGYQIVTQAATNVLTANSNISILAFTGATSGTATITFAPTPFDGQRLLVFTVAGFTSLTMTANAGQTVNSSPTSLAANSSAEFVYQASTLTWFRIS